MLRVQVAVHPDDVVLWQKLGHLLQKSHDDIAAAEAFSQAGRLYARDGFFLKAVALTKQVLNLDPNRVADREALGRSFEALQLNTEAKEAYKLALKHHQAINSVDGVVRMMEALQRVQ